MELSFYGVRGSIPRPLNSNEIVDRIAEQMAGKDINLASLRRLAKKGGITYGGNTSCVFLDYKKTRIIIDGGTGIRSLNPYYVQNKTEPVHILLTHLHWDHIQGLPFFAPFYIPGREVHIHSSLPAKDVKAAMVSQGETPYFPVQFDMLPANIQFHHIKANKKNKIGDFSVDALVMKHPQPTYSYRIQAGKRIYAHVSDTELTMLNQKEFAEYQKFLNPAHAIVADCQWHFEESIDFATWGHSSMHHFIEVLGKDCKGTVYFFHYNPQTPESHIDSLIDKAHKHLKLSYPKSKLSLAPAIEGSTIKV